MCVVSMVLDHYYDKWRIPNWPYEPTTVPFPNTYPMGIPYKPAPISDEEIGEFRRLLERAREYDRRMNQPDCELGEKKARIKKLADELGIKVDFL